MQRLAAECGGRGAPWERGVQVILCGDGSWCTAMDGWMVQERWDVEEWCSAWMTKRKGAGGGEAMGRGAPAWMVLGCAQGGRAGEGGCEVEEERKI